MSPVELVKSLFFNEADESFDDEIPAEYAEEIITEDTEVGVMTRAGLRYGVVYATWPEFGKVEVDYHEPTYEHNDGWLRETFDVSDVSLWTLFESETPAFADVH